MEPSNKKNVRPRWSLGRLLKQIPLSTHLRQYSWAKLGKDASAGLNVALLDFPQGMAYALIAGLPVQFGIFSSAIGSITGPLFASSRFLMLGPTNASAVLLLSGFLVMDLSAAERIMVLPLLLIMIAVIFFVGALLRFEVIIQYVSRCVISGYITAAACLIIVNQLKHVMNLDVPRASTFWENARSMVLALPQTDLRTLAFGGATVVIYWCCRRFKRLPAVAVTLVVMSIANYMLLHTTGYSVATLAGLTSSWQLTIPSLDLDLVNQLMGTAFAVAFLCLLESSSIAKTLAAQAGDNVNIRQQMVSMGVANVGNAFGSGMPVSGSLTRSVLNWKSGAVTPVSSMVSGMILVMGILLLGGYISYIPKASLAALVIIVGMSLIKPDQIRFALSVTSSDRVTFVVTFLGGLLLPLDQAIYLGMGLSLLFFLRRASKPKVVSVGFDQEGNLVEMPGGVDEGIAIVHVEGNLFYGSIDHYVEQVRHLIADPNIKVIILRMRQAHNIDATAALVIRELVQTTQSQGNFLLLSGMNHDVSEVMAKAGVLKVVGDENVFAPVKLKDTGSTRIAMERARKLIREGGEASP